MTGTLGNIIALANPHPQLNHTHHYRFSITEPEKITGLIGLHCQRGSPCSAQPRLPGYFSG
jgi:hypothetical protein